VKNLYPELYNIETLATAKLFLMEYMKKYMFLPGQIEQWVVLNNMSKLAIKELPRKEMGALVTMLNKNYMYVLAKSWNINCTTFQSLCWKVFELFLDKETSSKIMFFKEPNP
jgi:hypothetical protein